jgi:small subunit ribosomal protein S3
MEKHFIQEGIIRSEIESFLRNELDSAGYSSINIQKTPLSTRITLYVEKPPLVIGKKGRRIDRLTNILKEKYKVDNPSIDVQKVENPNLDPNIVARRIVSALERGMSRRRVVYKALRAVMDSGARGVEIVLSGKIIGKGGRARAEKYSEGYMKKAGDPLKLVNIGLKQAYLKAGVIGVMVKIVPPGAIFPDHIEVLEREKLVEGEQKKEEEEKIAEKEEKDEEEKEETKTKKKAEEKKKTSTKKEKKEKVTKQKEVKKKEGK